MSDEALMQRLLDGDTEALKDLHARYAPIVFGLARRSLGPAHADDVVQEVFLALWQRRALYDPTRGPLRPWLLSIAHTRVLNELRRQRRHPEGASEPSLDLQLDPHAAPDEQAWDSRRREAIQSAVDALPAPQRQVLRLAFFEDLSHAQVADFLGLPLGTTKTRIRAALKRLLPGLAPLIATVVLLVALALWWRQRTEVAREERGLRLVTASDNQALRLTAAAGAPPTAHATYRHRPGATTAVITLSEAPPRTDGRRYQAWARVGDRWTPLGTLNPDGEGRALLIAEAPGLAETPDALEVSLERDRVSQPTGEVFVSWTRGP